MGESRMNVEPKLWSQINKTFEMPGLIPPSPKWLILNEYVERKER